MINKDCFKLLSDKERAGYEFSFCEHCAFYKCELIDEYIQFRGNHKNLASKVLESSDAVLSLTRGKDREQGKNTTVVKAKISITSSKTCSIILKGNNSGTDLLSYNQEELKNGGCMMSARSVNQVECGRNTVADGIGDHYKIEIGHDFEIKTGITDRWEPSQPVTISAQTGQGKNYFVEHVLIPYVHKLNYENKTDQKVLILSNRLALKYQIKNRLVGSDNFNNKKGEIYPYKEVADIMTYQSLLEQRKRLEVKQKNGISRYIYVVCDEAHFFTSDAMFNPHTQKILSAIVSVFKKAIRIYMSATPYECLEYIIKYEKMYKSQYQYNQMVFYHFKRDYHYLNINSYSNIRELYNEIIISVKKKEKWIIFIDDKEKCRNVKRELEEHGEKMGIPMIIENEDSKIEKIFAVDATSRGNQDYETMVLNEKLNKDTYVLISTSVLDNGINLTGIHNVVISNMSKVKCLQMVGRARVSSVDDRKTLYVKRFNGDYVKNRLYDFMEQENAYHSYNLAYVGPDNVNHPKGDYEYTFLKKYYDGNDEDWKNAKYWFGRSKEAPTKLYLNEIAESQLQKLISRYQFIFDEMEEERKQGKLEMAEQGMKVTIGQKYLECQISWFGKKYCKDNDITFADKEKSKKEFVGFLESYTEKQMQIDQEKQMMFKTKFTQFYDAAFQREDPNLGRCYGIRKMNDLLKKQNISYRVISHSSYWTVVRFDWGREI